MEAALPGLEAALRPAWRGGVFGEVLTGGTIRAGDAVRWE
jgi:MOSC domain-containing protein YiiM